MNAPDKLAIACAQLNATVGDIAGNTEKARRARTEAATSLMPRFVTGLPPGRDA